MKHNSRKTLQPQVQDLLKGLFLKKSDQNPIYKLSDFKRIKMCEKEFKNIKTAKITELEKSAQTRDPALEALHLMDPSFLRGLTSNQFHRMLADKEINHNLAYQLQIYNYQEDQEQHQKEIKEKMKKGLKRLLIDGADYDVEERATNKTNLSKKNRKGEIISECPLEKQRKGKWIQHLLKNCTKE